MYYLGKTPIKSTWVCADCTYLHRALWGYKRCVWTPDCDGYMLYLLDAPDEEAPGIGDS